MVDLVNIHYWMVGLVNIPNAANLCMVVLYDDLIFLLFSFRKLSY